MFRPTRLLPLLLLPLAVGCDGALGGATALPTRDRSTHAEEGAAEAARERTREAPRRGHAGEAEVASETGEHETGEHGEAPPAQHAEEPLVEAPSKGADEAPASSGRSGGGSRRGGRGGGGEVQAALTVQAPGSGAGSGKVHGKALYAGSPPVRVPIPAAQAAADCHSEEPILDEEVVVHDGGLADVFVSIRKVPAGVTVPPPPSEPYVMDQHGCTYVPHVGAVQEGREIVARNSDTTGHNVHLYANKNVGVNSTIQPGGADLTISLPNPEKVRFGCDIHPWMGAELYVVDHPWFAVTEKDGSFALPDLPAGTYELEATHAKLGRGRSDSFTVAGGADVEVTFTFPGQ